MKILETIQAQAAAMRLPLYAVTLSAVAKADTPLLLMLHWHGFRRQSTLHLPNVDLLKRPVAGSALQIDANWGTVETLDEAMLHAAWKLGAWDLERVNHRPWWRLNAPQRETVDCNRAFGNCPDDADSYMLVEAPAQSLLLELAASSGYVRWLFRPRLCGIWDQLTAEDSTLAEDGARNSDCPITPAAYDRHRAGRQVYRLGDGRFGHLVPIRFRGAV